MEAGLAAHSGPDGAASDCAAATDGVLRCVASQLLSPGGESTAAQRATLVDAAGEHAVRVANGLMFLRNRIQVPRDMSTAAAATLREALPRREPLWPLQPPRRRPWRTL